MRGVACKTTCLGPVIRYIIDAGTKQRPLVVEESAASAASAPRGESVGLVFLLSDLRLFGENPSEAVQTTKEAVL